MYFNMHPLICCLIKTERHIITAKGCLVYNFDIDIGFFHIIYHQMFGNEKINLLFNLYKVFINVKV